MIALSRTLQKEIIEFLKSLPILHDSESQRAFICQAGLDQQLQEQIAFGKPSSEFIPLLVSKLIKYGTIEDGRNALETVLETTKNYIGQDKQIYCEGLLQRLKTNSVRLSRISSDKQGRGGTKKILALILIIIPIIVILVNILPSVSRFFKPKGTKGDSIVPTTLGSSFELMKNIRMVRIKRIQADPIEKNRLHVIVELQNDNPVDIKLIESQFKFFIQERIRERDREILAKEIYIGEDINYKEMPVLLPLNSIKETAFVVGLQEDAVYVLNLLGTPADDPFRTTLLIKAEFTLRAHTGKGERWSYDENVGTEWIFARGTKEYLPFSEQ